MILLMSRFFFIRRRDDGLDRMIRVMIVNVVFYLLEHRDECTIANKHV
jgi:hypothetical protein